MAAKSKECVWCGKEFNPPRSSSKYCSTECRDNARKDREARTCPQCGKEFECCRGSDKIYCNKECYDKAQTKLTIHICEVCGKEYKPKRESSKYCSKECYKKIIGKNVGQVHCLQCGKLFKQNYAGKLYCSKECVYEHMTNDSIECPICGRLFHSINGQKYCSQTCFGIAHSEYMKDKWNNSTEEEKKKWLENLDYEDNAISKTNIRFEEYFSGKGFSVAKEFYVGHRPYDLKVGETLIEINPSYTHNSTSGYKGGVPKGKDYHYNKMLQAINAGYRCIMIRDWDDTEKVSYLLDDNKETLYARNCELKQISRDECHDFFEQYHLQGDTKKNKNNIYVGLYYNNELVECMSFGIPRYNKKYEWEILRLCSHKKYKIVGGANRIFKKFLEITKANSVISYCDMSKFDGKVYESLGFNLLKRNKPSKHWYKETGDKSKRHITDNLLRQLGYDQIFNENFGKGTSNDELMKQRGYVEIFDCGQSTFVWQTELSYEIG